MKTILTGIRSNSKMTLGNYLGALLPMVRLANKHADEFQVNIFVPDLHSIISEVDGDLWKNTIRAVKYYLAAGLLINKNVHLYRQSYVPAHSELCWILDCVATMGETSRMIQYKEKSKGQESCNVGIFDYPVLMAADICLIVAILIGALDVPKWMAALNSIVFLIIGVTLRKINPKTFQDLPGIIMPSLGLAMVGLIGIASLIC